MIYILYAFVAIIVWVQAVLYPYTFNVRIIAIYLFVALIPLAIRILFKRKCYKKYLCIALCFCILAAWLPYKYSSYVQENWSAAYLSTDTPFHTAAKSIMPSLDSIDESYDVSYFYRKTLFSEAIAVKIRTKPEQFQEFMQNMYANYSLYPESRFHTVNASVYDNPFTAGDFLFCSIIPNYDELDKLGVPAEAAIGYNEVQCEIMVIFLTDDVMGSYGFDNALRDALTSVDWISR